MSIKRCQDKYGNVNLKSILCLIFLVVSEHLDVDFAQHAIFFKPLVNPLSILISPVFYTLDTCAVQPSV